MITALKGPGEVEVEILMTCQGHSGSFLVLEGEDDSRFWKPRVQKGHCELVIGGGKHAVVGGIQRLDRKDFRRAVGVVDDDCDRLRGIPKSSANLIHTDARDLEGILLQTSALHKVLAEYGDAAKIERFEAGGRTVREALLDRALPLGRLRWLAYDLGVDVDFKKLHPARFTSDTDWSFDEQSLLRATDEQRKLPRQPLLEAELAKLRCPDPWQVCQGHDLVQLLGIGLSGTLGNRTPGCDRISAVLRAGVDSSEFAALQLSRDLRAWENANAPFRVLP